MIPLKLELTNFLSYTTTQTLDFTGIELACIAGMNGAGKSSLLEGITWALFGQSRAEDVNGVVNRLAVTRGAHAEVRFLFELAGNEYQVIRRRKSGGNVSLEFQLKWENSWKTLTEKSAKETQSMIERTLNMDYETFINVSFFLQGKADQFTTKIPSKRKEFLSSLLGVNRWNDYKVVASDAVKAKKVELNILDRNLEEIEEELATRQSREQELEMVGIQAKQVKLQVETHELMVRTLRDRAEQAKHQKIAIDELSQQQQKLKRKLATTHQTLQQKEQDQVNHQQILADRTQIEQAVSDYHAAQQEEEMWQEKGMAYRRLQQEQQEFVRVIEKEKSRLEQEQRNLAEKAKTIVTYRQEVVECQNRLASAESIFAEIQQQLEQLKEKEGAYQSARDQLLQIENQRASWQKDVALWQKENDEVARWQMEQRKLEQDSAELPRQIEQWTTQLQTLHEQKELLTRYSAESATLEAAQQPLKKRMDELKAKSNRLEKNRGGDCPHCGQPITADHVEQVVANINIEGKSSGDTYRANRERIEELKSLMPTIEKETKSITQLTELLRAKQQRQTEVATRLREMERIFATWTTSGKEEQLLTLKEKLADQSVWQAKKMIVDGLRREVEPKSQLEKQQSEWERKIATDQAIIRRHQAEIARWEMEGEPASADVTRRLAENLYEQPARQKLAHLEIEMNAVGYDETAHQKSRQQKVALANAPKRFEALRIAETAMELLRGEIERLVEQQKEEEEEVLRLQNKLVIDRTRLEALSADLKDLDSAEEMLNQLRQQLKQHEGRVRDAEQRVDVLEDLAERKKRLAAERGDVAREIGRLQLIEEACGPKGVQSLLIEQALPEIEDRANELLLRLTDGEMQLRFNTQKTLKSADGVRETLEITLADNNGERPYENFSGGEQFRINFALRLALSQLLAKRAGTQLQTLVIDEGFGSQDPQGRQRLIEAINAIRPDFERILVITHIEELRDAFPTRIEVKKGLEGSHIVVYRGAE